MADNQSILKNFPGVDKVLNISEIKLLISKYNRELVTYCIRDVIDEQKNIVIKYGKDIPSLSSIVELVQKKIVKIFDKSLKSVINATGIVLHTNLGRAPFSKGLFDEASEVLTGYNNLEFDLNTGQRGSRYIHAESILKYLTGAEDIVVVNNNAAALFLILHAFAKNREVIVSRGELIEIGGSFRLPDIIMASDCSMVEVGTTNKTKLKDFEAAVSDQTAILLKVHRSNYTIEGFTQEVKLNEMLSLGKKNDIPVVYDMGSGLLGHSDIDYLKNEPDVKQILASGVDLVCFSGDKLLGGPQAGIIAGKKDMISLLKKHPLIRALRVGKLTIAFLEAICRSMVDDSSIGNNRLISLLQRNTSEVKRIADLLNDYLKNHGIPSEVVESKGSSGGGSMPGEFTPSYSVWVKMQGLSSKQRSVCAEKMYYKLLEQKSPVLGILRKGNLYFDMLTIEENQIDQLGNIISMVYREVSK